MSIFLVGLCYVHEVNTIKITFDITDVQEYWPDLDGDLTKVTWSHATNSQQKLAEALSGNESEILAQSLFVSFIKFTVMKIIISTLFTKESSKVMMMEADVSLGWLTGQVCPLLFFLISPSPFNYLCFFLFLFCFSNKALKALFGQLDRDLAGSRSQ